MEERKTKKRVIEARIDSGVRLEYGVDGIYDIYFPDVENYHKYLENNEISIQQIVSGHNGKPYATITYVTMGESEHFFNIKEDAQMILLVIIFKTVEHHRKFLNMGLSVQYQKATEWWKNNKSLYLGVLENHIKENDLYAKRN